MHPVLERLGLDGPREWMAHVVFLPFAASAIDLFLDHASLWRRGLGAVSGPRDRRHRIIEGHGAQIGFPTRTLHLPAGLRIESAVKPS